MDDIYFEQGVMLDTRSNFQPTDRQLARAKTAVIKLRVLHSGYYVHFYADGTEKPGGRHRFWCVSDRDGCSLLSDAYDTFDGEFEYSPDKAVERFLKEKGR